MHASSDRAIVLRPARRGEGRVIPAEKIELPLRIVVDDPVPGVALALQKGKSGGPELIEPARATPKAAVFELAVTASPGDNGALRLLGPFVQGPSEARFLYICVGTYAGQTGSPWARRIKVPLTDITAGARAVRAPRGAHRRAERERRAGGRQREARGSGVESGVAGI